MLRDLISTADATGDPELVERLAALRDRLTHTIAAAVVDSDAQPSTRWARVTTNKPRSVTVPEAEVAADPRFELGSITKALTGMLLANAIGGVSWRLTRPPARSSSRLQSSPRARRDRCTR